MSRGRKRTPTTVLELRGAFKNHPERKAERVNEPQVTTPLGGAPDVFNEAQRARWSEIAEWCPWLTIADRPVVEMAVRLWQAMRDGGKPDHKTLLACLAHLGMTPADRSKVKVPPKPEDKNPYAEFA